MLPCRPPVRHGSSDRTAAVTSWPDSSVMRTCFEFVKRPGGRGSPKLTHSELRSLARPSSLTCNTVELSWFSDNSPPKTDLTARSDASPVRKKDRLVTRSVMKFKSYPEEQG